MGPCKIIKNWSKTEQTFMEADATFRTHEIRRILAIMKRVIEDKVNSLLQVKGSAERRLTGEMRSLRALWAGGQGVDSDNND